MVAIVYGLAKSSQLQEFFIINDKPIVMVLQIDSFGYTEKITLHEFIKANTDEGEVQIAEDDIKQVENLQLGEETYLPVHAGWATIKRIA